MTHAKSNGETISDKEEELAYGCDYHVYMHCLNNIKLPFAFLGLLTFWDFVYFYVNSTKNLEHFGHVGDIFEWKE